MFSPADQNGSQHHTTRAATSLESPMNRILSHLCSHTLLVALKLSNPALIDSDSKEMGRFWDSTCQQTDGNGDGVPERGGNIYIYIYMWFILELLHGWPISLFLKPVYVFMFLCS